jgi:hypothetical protein
MTNLLILFAVLQISLTLWGYVDNINGLLKKKPYANLGQTHEIFIYTQTEKFSF